MDASSIITQVSRDDDLGTFNSEKGTYRALARCRLSSPREWLSISARCCLDFASPAPVTAPASAFLSSSYLVQLHLSSLSPSPRTASLACLFVPLPTLLCCSSTCCHPLLTPYRSTLLFSMHCCVFPHFPMLRIISFNS